MLVSIFVIFKIREQKPELAKRRLRLIYSGRLLADSIILHEWLAAQDAKKAQAGHKDKTPDVPSTETTHRNSMSSIRSKGKQRYSIADDEDVGEAGGMMGVSQQPTWIHCSLGAEIAEGEDEDDGQRTQVCIRDIQEIFPFSNRKYSTTWI